MPIIAERTRGNLLAVVRMTISDAAPRFIIGPCGNGWWWVIDTQRLTVSSPRSTKRDAEQRCREIAEQWQKAEIELVRAV